MIGGLFTSFLMELLVYPAIYYRWKWRAEVRHYEAQAIQEIETDEALRGKIRIPENGNNSEPGRTRK
jgi:hypothetical protein